MVISTKDRLYMQNSPDGGHKRGSTPRFATKKKNQKRQTPVDGERQAFQPRSLSGQP